MTATEHAASFATTVSAAKSLRSFSFDIAPEEVGLDLPRAAGAAGRRLLWRTELSVLGVGEALRIELGPPWVAEASAGLVRHVLSAIEQAGPPAQPRRSLPAAPLATELPKGPAAIGALPYDPGSAGHLVVPELLVACGSQAARVTWVVPRQGAPPRVEAALARLHELAAVPTSAPAPDSFTLTASMAHQAWKELVGRTVAAISRGELVKVVLARCVEVTANRPFVLPDVLARLASLYPSCAVFHCDGFIGASPETLVRRTGDQVVTCPLAGTIARSGDVAADEAAVAGLLSSAKARHEHRLVVDAIVSRLRPHCSALNVPSQPSVMGLRNVSHLRTPIVGTLVPGPLTARSTGSANGGPPNGGQLVANGVVGPGSPPASTLTGLPTALELAALLQPTPAVGGDPTQAAIDWQRASEGFDRGWYAGPLGWVDAAGDGEWVLGLRCALVRGEHAWLYAGNGIVAGSGPESELAETQLKLQALLAALVRP